MSLSTRKNAPKTLSRGRINFRHEARGGFCVTEPCRPILPRLKLCSVESEEKSLVDILELSWATQTEYLEWRLVKVPQ